MRGKSLEPVRRAYKRETGHARRFGGEGFRETRRCIESGANGCAALGQFKNARQRAFYAPDTVLDLAGITGEFLAECERRCILKMGAADLDDVGKVFRFAGECRLKLTQCGQ